MKLPLFFAILFLLSGSFAMAESPDVQVTYTDRETRYVLRPVSTSGAALPAWAVFTCLQGERVLGITSFRFSDGIESEVWDFWKPILEKIAAKKHLEIEIDGGFCLCPPVDAGAADFWAPAIAAPSPRESNIKVVEKTRGAEPPASE